MDIVLNTYIGKYLLVNIYYRNKNKTNHFQPIAPPIEHQLAPETIHTAITQYLERQYHPINMNLPQ